MHAGTGHQNLHEIHITFTWNTEAHINVSQSSIYFIIPQFGYIFVQIQYVSTKYPEDGFHDGCYQVIELDGDVIKIGLDKAKWTKVMDGQWELQPAKPMVCQTIWAMENRKGPQGGFHEN